MESIQLFDIGLDILIELRTIHFIFIEKPKRLFEFIHRLKFRPVDFVCGHNSPQMLMLPRQAQRVNL